MRISRNFLDHLPIFSLLANVADVKSLVIHPATTTHSQCTPEELSEQGIRPNTIPANKVAILAYRTLSGPLSLALGSMISDTIFAAAQFKWVSAQDIQAARTLSARIIPITGGILFCISHTSAWSPWSEYRRDGLPGLNTGETQFPEGS